MWPQDILDVKKSDSQPGVCVPLVVLDGIAGGIWDRILSSILHTAMFWAYFLPTATPFQLHKSDQI